MIIKGKAIRSCTLDGKDGTTPAELKSFVQEVELTRNHETVDDTALGDDEMNTTVLKGKTDATMRLKPDDTLVETFFDDDGDTERADGTQSRSFSLEWLARGSNNQGVKWDQELVITNAGIGVTQNGDASFNVTLTSAGGSKPNITRTVV